MTTLEAILAELRRQSGEPFGCYLSDDDPTGVTVDGSVDLVALAAAVDKARADELAEERREIDELFESLWPSPQRQPTAQKTDNPDRSNP